MSKRRLPSMSLPASSPASAVLTTRLISAACRLYLRHGLAFGDDFEQRRFAERVELHVRRAGNLFQDLPHFAGNLLDHGEVFAENFHRDVGARAFEDFVEAHLDGLAEQDGLRRGRACRVPRS